MVYFKGFTFFNVNNYTKIYGKDHCLKGTEGAFLQINCKML